MVHLDFIQLGEILRKLRKEKKLRLEDLEDEFISTATVSNIERGTAKVSMEKIEYLCKKLGYDLAELPKLYEKDQDEEDELKCELLAIENDNTLVSPEETLKSLRKIHLPNKHPLLSTVHYLKGKCYTNKNLWEKAIPHYIQAIRLADQHPELLTSNIKTAGYYELGRAYFYLNNLQLALKYTLEGIQAFVKDGERQYILYHLLISKVIYLRKLNRIEEAIRTLDEMWEQKDRIQSSEVLMTMYSNQVVLLNQLEMYREAINYALKGIELARLDKMYDDSLVLWTCLGNSYSKLGELKKAETCYRTASKLKKKIADEHLIVSTYTQLGILYTKLENMQLAKSVLEEAVKHGKKTKHGAKYCEALIALGDYYIRQGLYTEAIQNLEQALELAEQHALIEKKQNILLKLAHCGEKIDKETYHKYLERFFKIHLQLKERS